MFNPEREALGRVNLMLDKIGDVQPDLIPLSDYADENTYNFLLPKAGWTFSEWHAVNQAVARQLQARGFNVRMVRLELNAYIDFLATYHLDNNPQNRAQFVGWLTAPDNAKPTPI